LELEYTPRRRSSKRVMIWIWALLLIFACLGTAAAFVVYAYVMPNNEHKPIVYTVEKPIFYQGNQLKGQAIGQQESMKLPLELVQEWIDPHVVYEKASDSVIITTKDKVLQFKTSQLTGIMNQKPISLHFPVEVKDGTVYIPIAPLVDLYQIKLEEDLNTGAVILRKRGDVIQWGLTNGRKAGESYPLRHDPSIKSPLAASINGKESVMILEEQEGWFKVQLSNGWVGYMQEKDIALDRLEALASPEANPAEYIPWKPLGGKVNLTWEQVEKKSPDTSKLPAMPGLNVISPTWFHLADGEGNLKNHADPAYVKWAHSKGLQVWALFSNNFEPEQTTAALSTHERRMHMISQLLSFAKMYNLQGINIDFENVFVKDKANLTQFVREMTPLLHEQGLVVSIDVTIKGGSETWSQFYDRQALGEVVDYMMVMTYDEHWASSPKAGSVASLPWVEKGIVQIMKEDGVPASKLILGVPYYTRIWTESVENGKTKVTSRAVGMDFVRRLLADKKLTPEFSEAAGQNYVEYKEGNNVIKIWIEDEVSMKARAELVKKYDFGGIASWKRGLEHPDIWQVITNTLNSRP
jgi:spore germination protein YaaH